MAQSIYRAACDPFFKGCACCLTCPLSCNASWCKNCLNGCNNTIFNPICGDECIGIHAPLCGCCENCALCWYAGCCEYCYIADLSVATSGNKEKWKDVAYPLVFWYVMAQIFQQVGGMLPAASTGRSLCSTIQQIIEALLHISSLVMFGNAAADYAKSQSWTYEGETCCGENGCRFNLGCGDDGCGMGCGITPICCLTYWCCFQCHFVQVGRSMEGNASAPGNIKAGRPDECRDHCCDCWDKMGSAPAQGTNAHE